MNAKHEAALNPRDTIVDDPIADAIELLDEVSGRLASIGMPRECAYRYEQTAARLEAFRARRAPTEAPLGEHGVYEIARRGLHCAQRAFYAAAQGDQDHILEQALLMAAHAAILATRMGDPVGFALLEYLRNHNDSSELWGAKSQALARLEHAITAHTA